MNEEVKMYMDEAKEQMQNALVHLENELAKIRAGKANPKILNDVLVDYYGSPTPLSQVANITAPDPRTIAVQPWEKNMLGPIQKAIMNANLGFNPDNNGEVVRINVPPFRLFHQFFSSLGSQGKYPECPSRCYRRIQKNGEEWSARR